MVQPAPDPKGNEIPCAGSLIADNSLYNFYSFSGWQSTVGEDAGSYVADPNFGNPVYPYDDYSLGQGAQQIGFVPFDVNAAGRYSSGTEIEPPAIAPTFSTMIYNPATDF